MKNSRLVSIWWMYCLDKALRRWMRFECIGEDQDGVVRRRLGEVDGGRRGPEGITAVQCFVQIANVVGWCATNHASL